MSPTSYQAAPPRISILTTHLSTVKFSGHISLIATKNLVEMKKAELNSLRLASQTFTSLRPHAHHILHRCHSSQLGQHRLRNLTIDLHDRHRMIFFSS